MLTKTPVTRTALIFFWRHVEVSGQYAYLGVGTSLNGTLVVIDVSNPARLSVALNTDSLCAIALNVLRWRCIRMIVSTM